jgi:hypothetical protein
VQRCGSGKGSMCRQTHRSEQLEGVLVQLGRVIMGERDVTQYWPVGVVGGIDW